jgi:two-component sensor histidine kinase
VKNTLGTVQAMAVQTFRQAPLEERNSFVGRLHALAEAHDALTQREWGSVALSEMTKRALHPFVDTKQQRISARGADTQLSPNRALLISMVLHELGTNAVKYGALSSDCGTVDLVWEIVDAPSRRRLRLLWTEQGGPAVAAPSKKGFGSRMIEHAIRGEQGTSDFRFAPEGLVCTIEMPI